MMIEVRNLGQEKLNAFKEIEELFDTELAIEVICASNAPSGWMRTALNRRYPEISSFIFGTGVRLIKKEGEYVFDNTAELTFPLKKFLENMGSLEWEMELEKISFFREALKCAQNSFIDYITFEKPSGTDISKWRDSFLFNNRDMWRMISEADFNLKYSPFLKRYKLEDRQQANLGGIEDESFGSVREAFERMEVYFIDLYDRDEDEE